MLQPSQLGLFYFISNATYPYSLSYVFVSYSVSSTLSYHRPQGLHLCCLYSTSCHCCCCPALRAICQYGRQYTFKNHFFLLAKAHFGSLTMDRSNSRFFHICLFSPRYLSPLLPHLQTRSPNTQIFQPLLDIFLQLGYLNFLYFSHYLLS